MILLMGTDKLGPLLRVRLAGPRLVQLVYEKGVVTKSYHTAESARVARDGWSRLAAGEALPQKGGMR